MTRAARQIWVDVIGHHRHAQIAREEMNDPRATQQAKDLAAARFIVSSQALVDRLTRASEIGLLAKITLLLAKEV